MREQLAARVHDLMGDADICLSPTTPLVAPPLGFFDNEEDPVAWFTESAQLGAFTAAFNLTQGPAASLPVGLTPAGLPIGAQIAARPGQDRLLLALSRQIEQAQPWQRRRARGYDL